MAGAPRIPASATRPEWGQKAALAAAEQAVPVADAPESPMPLLRPTERPEEPVTAGVPMGAGPGPEALGGMDVMPGSRADLALRVRAIYARFPNPNLAMLLRDLETGR